jgi:hypothetical protein
MVAIDALAFLAGEERRRIELEAAGEGRDVGGGELAFAAEDAGGEGTADIEEAGEVGAGEVVGFEKMAQDIEGAGGGRRSRLVIALVCFDEVAKEGEVIGLVAREAVAGEGVRNSDGFAVLCAVADRPGQENVADWRRRAGKSCCAAVHGSPCCEIAGPCLSFRHPASD